MTKGLEMFAQDAPEPVPEPRPTAYHLPMVVWIHDGPVCVTIVDTPPPPVRHGVCGCDACTHARLADLPFNEREDA